MPDQPRVFISYARQDGEKFAKALYERLECEEPEITLWQDRTQLEGGVGWWKQIAEAINTAQFLVLVMTPAALQSSVTRKEWRYARQQGVCVYPVKGVPDNEINYGSLPRWMRKSHFFDLDLEWRTFINYLKSPCRAIRVPFMAPDLPEGFVERPELFEPILKCLLDVNRPNLSLTTALHGAGGLGKTTLAAALCHHDETITTFDDGVLWITLGKKPNVYEGLTKLYAALTGERPGFIDNEDATFHLSEKLEGKNCLIVIDDVWDAADLRPFMRGGKDCVRLITTRIFEIAADTFRFNVDEMATSEAVQMLTLRLGSAVQDLSPFRKLSKRLHSWPLLLELAGAALRHRISRSDTPEGALLYLKRKLDVQGVLAFDHRNPLERSQAFAKTMEVSLELLGRKERQRCIELSVLPEDTDIPLSVVSAMWELDEFDSEELIQRLDNLSLLNFSLQAATIRLHDVVRAYFETQLVDAEELHRKLTKAWGDPHYLPHDYAWRWLTYHLSEGGQTERLQKLLIDFEWMQAKLEATDVITLISDYDSISNENDLKLVQSAIKLSAHVVSSDKSQLASQLLARLRADESPKIKTLCQQIEQLNFTPWLRPLFPILTSPGGALLFTLSNHAGRVRSVVITSDNQKAISCSDDHTLKVWDLKRGVEERTLAGHSDWVRAVAVLSNKFRAVSASDDHTIKIWDIENGTVILTINTQGDWIRALAVTPDEQYAISASDDRTLKMWDLERGTLVRMFKGHSGEVNAVAVSPNGRFLISGSDDRTIKIWDLSSGTEVRTLKGHRAKLYAVAVTSDGRYIISASADDTLRIWDLESSNSFTYTITDRAYGVRGLAVTSDGRRIISSSEDLTIKVWDLNNPDKEHILEGHTDWVNSIAVTSDGQQAISASDDQTLKFWEIHLAAEPNVYRAHADRVRAVVVTPDGHHAVSTSDDRTLLIWDMALNTVKRAYTGFNHWVMAVTPDSKRIISASGHAELKVWEIVSGLEKCAFTKHMDRIRALSISPDGCKAISAADDRTIRVWNVNTGNEELRRDVQVHWIRDLAVTPDGKYFLSASNRPTIKLWNLKNGKGVKIFSGHTAKVNSIDITPDGSLFVSASDDHTLRVWNFADSTEKFVLIGHTAKVNAVAVTKDCRTAISASDDYTLRVWDLMNGKIITIFTGESPFLCCAVSPYYRTVVAGDQSGIVHFLKLEGVR